MGNSIKNNAIKFLNGLINDQTPKCELDIISYLKRLVKADFEPTKNIPEVDYMPYFEYLWKMYPRKVAKQNAIKQFEKKVRALSEEEIKTVCNTIYVKLKKRIAYWQEKETDTEFIPHFATYLNSEVPNSKYYKGR